MEKVRRVEAAQGEQQEFATVKSTLKQGKSAGPDGIPPEVLKNCDLDDIILEICNLALMENNKPDIWSL
ncbi:hypothetical protein AAFF_G00275920 [Aldrovandia affinis]|uniref:Uncharacterized protein n=1 Tax=Aldrovandia affinis TaxID=143900 RepID=A0AAD7W257_9TELE|nr:hypothetical protein AAFF_G00275920 [Aldrovandia affinis]